MVIKNNPFSEVPHVIIRSFVFQKLDSSLLQSPLSISSGKLFSSIFQFFEDVNYLTKYIIYPLEGSIIII